MSETKWEPTPEAVEALANKRLELAWPGATWRPGYIAERALIAAARAELIERHEREAPLLDALRQAGTRLQYLGDVVSAPRVWDALRAHAALDAPPKPEPTLVEAVEALVEHVEAFDWNPGPLADVKAALARHKAQERA